MQIGNKNYEILVRRQGENVYAAFCPQLELIVRGTAHEQVENKMKQLIQEHVAKEEGSPDEGGQAGDTKSE
jgi:predicted RNase H-like HicB family nuclease